MAVDVVESVPTCARLKVTAFTATVPVTCTAIPPAPPAAVIVATVASRGRLGLPMPDPAWSQREEATTFL